ncbi:MAG: serine/threonine protein kinase [Planctomycetes bacterium]|nr:serine/threonine protein kinase [Planctomycetota bacterium]
MPSDPFAIAPAELAALRFEIPEAETMVAADTLVGKRLGKYHLHKRLGIGGWGVAYYARHLITDKPFTVKVLSDRLAVSTVFVRRFLKEARVTAQLDHPNIRQVVDVDQELAHYYMVMEFVDGVGLHSLIWANRTIPPRIAARLAGQIARGLAYAKGLGIIHRDVKPRNLLVGRNGIAKLTDFGLAQVLEESDEQTQAAGVLQTLEFQSPEHLAGWECDAKNDIYGLGVSLFYMLTGRVPFSAPDKYTLLQRIETEETPSPQKLNPAVPTALAAIVMNMMHQYPFLRLASWSEVIEELEQYARESAASAGATPAKGEA